MDVIVWILTLCTASSLGCWERKTIEYQTEAQCYKAMDNLYKYEGKEAFEYITCSIKK